LVNAIDGTKPCLADLSYRKRRDQFINYAIISSVDQSVVTLLGNVKSSKQAWDIFKKTFASKTGSTITHLKKSSLDPTKAQNMCHNTSMASRQW
jgi:hypothetical protein